jgi:hypothetical protein
VTFNAAVCSNFRTDTVSDVRNHLKCCRLLIILSGKCECKTQYQHPEDKG